jgi:tRNA (guanine-N7-)-methyltransferase
VADPEAPRVRTYHARRGRLSDRHQDSLATIGATWLVDSNGAPLDLGSVFGRAVPVVLDIGCGMGESTLVQAAKAPDVGVIAIDVHTRGVATLMRKGDRDGLTNVRVVHGDAVTFIDQRLAPASIVGARIYFPDPWPKARHRKRRLVQPEFVALLADRIAPGGFVHCATDDQAYAQQMVEVLGADPRLENPFDGFAPRSIPGAVDRPSTKYERRGERLGHLVRDVWVTRRLPS